MGEELEAKLEELARQARQRGRIWRYSCVEREEKRARETSEQEHTTEANESDSFDEMQDAATNRLQHTLWVNEAYMKARFPFVDEEVHRDEFGVIPVEYKPVLAKKEEEEEEEEEDYFEDVSEEVRFEK